MPLYEWSGAMTDLEQLSPWKLIQSAPHDGRPLLLCVVPPLGGRRYSAVGYHVFGRGWVAENPAGSGRGPVTPTHWIPLPKLPDQAPSQPLGFAPARSASGHAAV
jgi:hypothetical protein